MKMQKMLLVGAMFMTLVNVNILGAWAAPAPVKVATVVAAQSDDGCPATASVTRVLQPMTEQPDPATDLPQIVESDACQAARTYLASTQKTLKDLQDQLVDANAQLVIAQKALKDAAPEERTIPERNLRSAQTRVDTTTGQIAFAKLAVEGAQRDVETLCGVQVIIHIPPPRPLPELQAPDTMFTTDRSVEFS